MASTPLPQQFKGRYMSDQTVFDTDDNSQATPVHSSGDPFADQLSVIKNEKGEQKYKDVETALAALNESQQYIKQLKEEKAQADEIARKREEELAKMGSIEDFVKRVSPNSQTSQEEPDPVTPTGLSEEDVAKLVQSQLTSVQQQQTQEANLNNVINQLASVHGDNLAKHIKDVAEETGTTPAALKDLAKSNPQLALKVLGGGAKTPDSSATSMPKNITQITQQDNNIRPTVEKGKGAARGGRTDKELAELFRQSKAYTNKRLGLE